MPMVMVWKQDDIKLKLLIIIVLYAELSSILQYDYIYSMDDKFGEWWNLWAWLA